MNTKNTIKFVAKSYDQRDNFAYFLAKSPVPCEMDLWVCYEDTVDILELKEDCEEFTLKVTKKEHKNSKFLDSLHDPDFENYYTLDDGIEFELDNSVINFLSANYPCGCWISVTNMK